MANLLSVRWQLNCVQHGNFFLDVPLTWQIKYLSTWQIQLALHGIFNIKHMATQLCSTWQLLLAIPLTWQIEYLSTWQFQLDLHGNFNIRQMATFFFTITYQLLTNYTFAFVS